MTYIYWSVHSTIHIKSFFTFLYLLNLFFLCSIYWISYFFMFYLLNLLLESLLPVLILYSQCRSMSCTPSVKEQCSAHSLAWTQPSTVRWPCCHRRPCHVIANCSAAALANIYTRTCGWQKFGDQFLGGWKLGLVHLHGSTAYNLLVV